MTQKRMIHEVVQQESPVCWPSDIDEIIKRLQELKSTRELKPGESMSLEFDRNFYYDYDPHPTPMFLLYHYRLENDSEFQVRMAKEQERRDELAARDRAEFERLSKKFK